MWTLELLGTEGHEFIGLNIMKFYLTYHAWPVGWWGCVLSSETITCILLHIFAIWQLTLCQFHLPFDRLCFQSCWVSSNPPHQASLVGVLFSHQQPCQVALDYMVPVVLDEWWETWHQNTIIIKHMVRKLNSLKLVIFKILLDSLIWNIYLPVSLISLCIDSCLLVC